MLGNMNNINDTYPTPDMLAFLIVISLLEASLCDQDLYILSAFFFLMLGGNALQVMLVMWSDYFFQETSKVTHYFYIYKEI